jgi:hypothetical protein
VLPKPGEICKHLARAYNSNSHARGLHYLTFVRGKQAEKSTQWGKSFSGKLSIINPLLKEGKPLQFEFTNIAAKKPQPLL